MPFSSLGLSLTSIKALVEEGGFTEPTPIQKKAIPIVVERKDLLAIARTGSGKTVSYVLPIVQRMAASVSTRHRDPEVLVLVPTRELADQVYRVFQQFLPEGVILRSVTGGVSINPQMQILAKVNILVATPGRLLELAGKNAVKLSSVSMLILDEADKMLNLGFKKEIDQILSLVPKQRQTLLFSATLSDDLNAIQKGILIDPVVIKIAEEESGIDLIKQRGYFVTEERKGPLLRYLIKSEKMKQVLVFASSTTKVDGIVNKLRKNKVRALAIHSKMSQEARRDALREFKAGNLPVLVSTDLLARGIDIEFLPYVINYELPRSPKDYVHRIGRTGRAENPGEAISLVTMDEWKHFKVIEKKMGKRVEMQHSDPIDLHGY